ncbi:RNA polymerase sigma factor [Marinimicrobium sp. ABcell2]|uniref:RNA polymerase sigma factor n=1 Tax=Marinimicrobium sp. ABcell2 TaxID=3069751 RepID=UPI0027B369FC|nr:RNA polymerase sigma factor [Marinimicrobium sp. ABcell2]MDQ2076396.1 RNA polymerase sigma factor [Marinimicrobium sp. ABcell2]
MKSDLTEVLPQLRRFAYSLTGAMDDADDLLQSTVERALNHTVPEGVDLTKWLFRVCRNLWIDDYRSRKVRQEATLQPQLRDREIVDGERAMSSEIELDQVSRAMDKLPDDQRAVLSLVAVQGMSYKEVAATLEIPAGTVMSRLARARTALTQSLNIPVARTSA